MNFQRLAERMEVMELDDSVQAFHQAGVPGGPLFPIYHFNAIQLSQLLPAGGTVLDVGCGSGRFLQYFLQGRPDAQGIGMDLSRPMLQLAEQGFQDDETRRRVSFVQGAFTQMDSVIHTQVDAIVCLSALHHCPDYASLVATLQSLARLQEREECAVWLFDVVRPELEALTELIPRTFEVSSRAALPPAFRQDWIDSLKAGWTVEEMQQALGEARLHLTCRSAHYSQLHWRGRLQNNEEISWSGPSLSARDWDRARALTTALWPPPVTLQSNTHDHVR